MGKARNRSYKELTLSELRCFFETVRKGSFSAAAAALGVSHPTVLQQVRALESQLGAKLVEPPASQRGDATAEKGQLSGRSGLQRCHYARRPARGGRRGAEGLQIGRGHPS